MLKNIGLPIDGLRKTKTPENIKQSKSIVEHSLNLNKQHIKEG